jgi:hypothetical protein
LDCQIKGKRVRFIAQPPSLWQGYVDASGY